MDSNNAGRLDVDVLIVGGGMAGGLMACALASSSLSVLVIDAGGVPSMPSGDAEMRVSAITEASFHMLENVGAWQCLAADRLAPYTSMDVWDADGSGRVTFDAGAVQAEQLGWIVENSALTAALYQCCQGGGQEGCQEGDEEDRQENFHKSEKKNLNNKNIDWRYQTRIKHLVRQEGGWRATLSNDDEIHATLIVGADGARSMVRSAAGIAAAPKESGHRAIVATIETEKSHQFCARQRFMDSGPLALLPLFGNGQRFSLVWSLPPERAEQLMLLGEEEFERQLTLASEAVLGNCRLVGRRGVFPIHTLHASEYIASHLALIGDAAHVVHPLAGQGINLGFLDAAVLAEEMLRAHDQGLSIAEPQVLARYQRRRRGHNGLVLNALNGLKSVFGQKDPAVRFIRNTGMRWVNNLPMAKSLLASEALGRHGDRPALAKKLL